MLLVFGATYFGKHVGTLGTTGCFSFHPRKAITTGEGGMVTTSDSKLADRIRCLRDHGATMSDLQRHMGAKPYLLADHPEAGYNQRMTDIQAALGSAQMNRAHEIVQERRRLANIYNDAFSNLDWLQTPSCYDGYEHGYQSYPAFRPKNLIHNIKVNLLEILGWKHCKLQASPRDQQLMLSICFLTIKRSMDVSRKIIQIRTLLTSVA